MYVHLCVYVFLLMFCNSFFFLLCAFGTLWGNYRMAFPEKVPGSAKNTATVYAAISWIFMLCVTT